MKRTVWIAVSLAVACNLAGAWNPLFRRAAGAARWDATSAVVWNPDGGPLGGWDNSEALDELTLAFAKWEGVSTSVLSFVQGPQIADVSGNPVDVDAANIDAVFGLLDNGQNPIVFDNNREIFDMIGQPNSVIGFSGILSVDPNGEIRKAYAILQGDWFDGDNADVGELSQDGFRSMLVHELGHVSGLGHTSVNHEFSGSGIPGCPPPSDAQLATMGPDNHDEALTLHHDDRIGISTLYPTPAFAAGFARLQGRLFDIDGVTGFDGANIVLRPDTTDCDQLYEQAQAMQSGVNPAEDGGKGGFGFSGLIPSSGFKIEARAISGPGGYPLGGSNPPELSGPAEFYNGGAEDAFSPPDDPGQATVVLTGPAGSATGNLDILLNNPGGPGEVADASLRVQKFDGATALPPESLALDDSGAEGAFGVDGTARLAWLQRLRPPASRLPFRIERIDVLFVDSSAPAGRPIRLLVYVDPAGTGDPGNAVLAHTQDTTIQFVSPHAFNKYTLSTPVELLAGDVYIGAYDLVADVGAEPNAIAALDVDTASGAAFLQVDGTAPSGFVPATDFGLPDLTWMIHAHGRAIPAAGTIRLSWSPSCSASVVPNQGFAVYEGSVASLPGSPDHQPIACASDPEPSLMLNKVAADRFWLVAPLLASREGEIGVGTGAASREPAAVCRPRVPDTCY